eukprot:jgi/Chlat1/6730/Chrsp50S06475
MMDAMDLAALQAPDVSAERKTEVAYRAATSLPSTSSPTTASTTTSSTSWRALLDWSLQTLLRRRGGGRGKHGNTGGGGGGGGGGAGGGAGGVGDPRVWEVLANSLSAREVSSFTAVNPTLLNAVTEAATIHSITTTNSNNNNNNNNNPSILKPLTDALRVLYTKFERSFRPGLEQYASALEAVLPHALVDESDGWSEVAVVLLEGLAKAARDHPNPKKVFALVSSRLLSPLLSTLNASNAKLAVATEAALAGGLFHPAHTAGFVDFLSASGDGGKREGEEGEGEGEEGGEGGARPKKRKKKADEGEGQGGEAPLPRSYHKQLFQALSHAMAPPQTENDVGFRATLGALPFLLRLLARNLAKHENRAAGTKSTDKAPLFGFVSFFLHRIEAVLPSASSIGLLDAYVQASAGLLSATKEVGAYNPVNDPGKRHLDALTRHTHTIFARTRSQPQPQEPPRDRSEKSAKKTKRKRDAGGGNDPTTQLNPPSLPRFMTAVLELDHRALEAQVTSGRIWDLALARNIPVEDRTENGTAIGTWENVAIRLIEVYADLRQLERLLSFLTASGLSPSRPHHQHSNLLHFKALHHALEAAVRRIPAGRAGALVGVVSEGVEAVYGGREDQTHVDIVGFGELWLACLRHLQVHASNARSLLTALERLMSHALEPVGHRVLEGGDDVGMMMLGSRAQACAVALRVQCAALALANQCRDELARDEDEDMRRPGPLDLVVDIDSVLVTVQEPMLRLALLEAVVQQLQHMLSYSTSLQADDSVSPAALTCALLRHALPSLEQDQHVAQLVHNSVDLWCMHAGEEELRQYVASLLKGIASGRHVHILHDAGFYELLPIRRAFISVALDTMHGLLSQALSPAMDHAGDMRHSYATRALSEARVHKGSQQEQRAVLGRVSAAFETRTTSSGLAKDLQRAKECLRHCDSVMSVNQAEAFLGVVKVIRNLPEGYLGAEDRAELAGCVPLYECCVLEGLLQLYLVIRVLLEHKAEAPMWIRQQRGTLLQLLLELHRLWDSASSVSDDGSDGEAAVEWLRVCTQCVLAWHVDNDHDNVVVSKLMMTKASIMGGVFRRSFHEGGSLNIVQSAASRATEVVRESSQHSGEVLEDTLLEVRALLTAAAEAVAGVSKQEEDGAIQPWTCLEPLEAALVGAVASHDTTTSSQHTGEAFHALASALRLQSQAGVARVYESQPSPAVSALGSNLPLACALLQRSIGGVEGTKSTSSVALSCAHYIAAAVRHLGPDDAMDADTRAALVANMLHALGRTRTRSLPRVHAAMQAAFRAYARACSRPHVVALVQQLESVLRANLTGQSVVALDDVEAAVDGLHVVFTLLYGPKNARAVASRAERVFGLVLAFMMHTHDDNMGMCPRLLAACARFATSLLSREARFPAIPARQTALAMQCAGDSLRSRPTQHDTTHAQEHGVLAVQALTLLGAALRRRPRETRRLAAHVARAAHAALNNVSADGVSTAAALARLYEEFAARKEALGKYVPYLLADYIGAVVAGNFSRAATDALRSGAFALLDACTHFELQLLHAAFASDEARRTAYTLLRQDYEQHHKYTGKADIEKKETYDFSGCGRTIPLWRGDNAMAQMLPISWQC